MLLKHKQQEKSKPVYEKGITKGKTFGASIGKQGKKEKLISEEQIIQRKKESKLYKERNELYLCEKMYT